MRNSAYLFSLSDDKESFSERHRGNSACPSNLTSLDAYIHDIVHVLEDDRLLYALGADVGKAKFQNAYINLARKDESYSPLTLAHHVACMLHSFRHLLVKVLTQIRNDPLIEWM